MKAQLEGLHRAAIEVARGFERAQNIQNKVELRAALAEASAALIEMRRATDSLSQQLRFETDGVRR